MRKKKLIGYEYKRFIAETTSERFNGGIGAKHLISRYEFIKVRDWVLSHTEGGKPTTTKTIMELRKEEEKARFEKKLRFIEEKKKLGLKLTKWDQRCISKANKALNPAEKEVKSIWDFADKKIKKGIYGKN
jgi:hypothetical protein